MIIVGYLIPFTIIKALPGYDTYLAVVIGKGVLAQLPKKHAFKEYKIGESGWAAVFKIEGARITLSQKSPQYIRKVLESVMSDLIQTGNIKFKKVAKISNAHFYKVTVDSPNGLSGKEIVKLCLPYLKEIDEYIVEKIILVRYSTDIKEYISNSLVPAPVENIKRVILFHGIDEANVYVDEHYAGYFLGPKGRNVSTASKLTGYKITIIPA